MDNLDADTLAQQAIRIGLVSQDQLNECRDECGAVGLTPEALLRALERKGYLTSYQSNKLLRGDPTGYFLGNYRILYRIAAGSFGRVFRGDDPRTGMVVAVKVLRLRWTKDPRSVELFEREAKLGLTLQHPNIVSILSIDRDAASNKHYIVMEFVEGGNLRDFLQIRKKLEPSEALRLLEDAVQGLAYAFSCGITHRDMKLTNILISSQGNAKLVDFGLAGLTSSTSDVEEQGDHSVDYAGLEKVTNVPPGDVRSDIYFLGCVFYEMLTGRPPLLMTKDRQVRQQRDRFLNAAPIAPSEVIAPPSVFKLIETMMSLDPRQRFQTPDQLLEAVRAARHDVVDKRTQPAIDMAAEMSDQRTIFVIEKHDRLREVIGDKFRELGFRVLLSADPNSALSRFRRRPFDALFLDVETAGVNSLALFDQVLREAKRQGRSFAGILLLAQDQADLADTFDPDPSLAILVRPITFRQLYEQLCRMIPPRIEDGE